MVLAKASEAPKPRAAIYQKVAWAYAALLVVVVLAQLFAFEKFIPILRDYHLPGGEGTATLAATIIVIVEVFALPFLLRMPLSPLMRWCSAVFAVLVPVSWLLLGIVAAVNGLTDGGMLGAKVDTPPVAMIGVSLVLALLAGLSIWGLTTPTKK